MGSKAQCALRRDGGAHRPHNLPLLPLLPFLHRSPVGSPQTAQAESDFAVECDSVVVDAVGAGVGIAGGAAGKGDEGTVPAERAVLVGWYQPCCE